MILVFFIVLFTIFIIAFISSKLEIEIDKFEINNQKLFVNNNNLNIEICLKVFNIKFIKIKLNKNKLEKIYSKIEKNNINSHKKLEINKTINLLKNKKIINEIKNINFKLDKLDLKMNIGLEDCVITSYLIGLISIIVSNILPHIVNSRKDISNYKYEIMPSYNNKNVYNIQLNCIINAKLVHIINIIFLIKKRRSDKYERTSNRKSYDYSYE